MNYKVVGMLSLGHMLTDINQGAVPALLPFLISEHNLTYAAAAGIVFATNFSSTIVQPLFGHAADRFSKPWLLPLGVLLAGLGIGLTGIVPSYGWILLVSIFTGIGVAAYHPEGVRLANLVSGEKKGTAMSLFGVGGTFGFAVGPIFITSALLYLGIHGTLVLLVPVSIMAIILFLNMNTLSVYSSNALQQNNKSSNQRLQDAWAPFARLTLMVITRSILFFGLNTFIPLYWIHVLGQSKAAGATALTIMAGSGVIGNLMGGWLADRFGHRKLLWIGLIALIPLFPALLWAKNVYLATLLLVPIGLSMFGTYSPTIVMAQKYLPNHIGLSAGITIGVAVTVGGVSAPLLGKIADIHGIWSALAAIMIFPVISAGIGFTLPIPKESLIEVS
jgi:FSR family fosmidomycin resistance protein-like MFS transporter